MPRSSQLKREVILVPVLRAGLGMLDSILQLIPHARVGFIGLKREEKSLRALFYHKSLPRDQSKFEVILIDPMLATGGSAASAMELLTELGAKHSPQPTLVAAPEGIPRDTRITAACLFLRLSIRLNRHGYRSRVGRCGRPAFLEFEKIPATSIVAVPGHQTNAEKIS